MKVPSNKVTDVVKYYQEQLMSIYDPGEARSLLFILLKHFFKIERLDLVKDTELRLSESELLKIHFSVKELMKHKPVQHITGYEEFCGFRFKVDENVLIPRPETEELVDMIVSEQKDMNQRIVVLDVGTGSGCIAISLKKKLANIEVYAIDNSLPALKLAKENAKSLNATVRFIEADIMEDELSQLLPGFDIIVSNPPYIRNSEKKFMKKNVLDYDPHQALFVSDDDPLIFYKSIAQLGLEYLKPGGKIYFEINEAFARETMKTLKDFNYSGIKMFEDFRGKERFISANLIKK